MNRRLGFLVSVGLCLGSAQAGASIDMSKARILSCAGPPNHEVRVGSLEYLYYKGRVATGALPTGTAELIRGEECETVIVLQNGRGVSADWRRSKDILRGQLCTPRVNRCLQD